MSRAAAKDKDGVRAHDLHIEVVQGTPTIILHEFDGALTDALSPDVLIEHKAAATVQSIASNAPPHTPHSGPFQKPPTNEGTVVTGAATVLVNHKPLARDGDRVMTCNDPMDLPVGIISAFGTVKVGK